MSARPGTNDDHRRGRGASVSDDVAEASQIAILELTDTCFEDLSPEIATRLLARSRSFDVRAGEIVFPGSDQSAHAALVLSGTVRSFVTAADGRQATVRYARRGALIGKYSSLVGAHAPLGVQAMTHCTVLDFDTDVFSSLAATEVSVARAIMVELARRLEDVYATVGDNAFGSIRQRLVRHLLALARDGGSEDEYRVSITHQQLANAIGSSREVVARAVGRLREEGMVRTGPREIVLTSVDRLVSSLNEWRAESPY